MVCGQCHWQKQARRGRARLSAAVWICSSCGRTCWMCMSNMKTVKAEGGPVPLLIGTSMCRDYDRIKKPQTPKTFAVPVKCLPLITTQGHIIVSNAALTQSQQQKQLMYLRWGRPNLKTNKQFSKKWKTGQLSIKKLLWEALVDRWIKKCCCNDVVNMVTKKCPKTILAQCPDNESKRGSGLKHTIHTLM